MARTAIPPKLVEKARAIRLLLLDVDGVMTDGRIVMDDSGREWKFFDVKDGHGLKMLMRYGIGVALITGRTSAVVKHRAKDLGVVDIHQGVWDKVKVFEEILLRRDLAAGQVAFVGDDIVDVPVLRRVGLAIAVADAFPEVQQAAHWVTSRPGGRGAVREVCDLLLKAQGYWEELVGRYGVAQDHGV